MPFFALMITPSSYGVLSVTTANVIKGRVPTFTNTSGAKKLGFKVNNVSYSEQIGNLSSSNVNDFDAGLSLNQFQVTYLSATDFNVMTDYYDSDGDEPHPTTPFTMAWTSYEWRDGTGTRINDMTKTIGCSRLTMPLELTIYANVQVHSKYGYPKDSGNNSLSKTYKIDSLSGGICYAKPNSMKVYPGEQWIDGSMWQWNTSYPYTSPVHGGGYTSDFIVVTDSRGNLMDGGFKPSAYRKFPTTGFPGALFQLVMSGSQRDYTYSVSVSPSGAVKVDTDGNVKLVRKPNGNVTIKATSRINSSKQYTYTFNPTSVWILPYGGKKTYYQAINVCGSEANIPSRSDLTNSPGIYATEYTWDNHNYYTRAIGGGVFAEWGYVDSSSYPGFPTIARWLWTKDQWYSGSGLNFVIDIGDGFVGRNSRYDTHEVACLG
ncbi:hypothetical protein RCS94_00275 [Orbaceae bacterium ac157xtp]